MKTKELLSRYADGERNFCRVSLKGSNLRNQDISGIDLSGADIRSANFTNSNLQGANFSNVQSGLQIRRFFLFQLLLFYLLDLAGSLLLRIPLEFSSQFTWNYGFRVFDAMIYLLLLPILALTLHQGFTVRGISRTILLVTVLLFLPVSMSLILHGGISVQAFILRYILLLLTSVSLIIIILVVSLVIVANRIFGILLSIGACLVPFLEVQSASNFIISNPATMPDLLIDTPGFQVAILVIFIAIISSFFVARKALRGDEKFSLVHTLGVRLGALGGTQFRGADLTDANFAQANLKRADFSNSRKRPTKFTRICWHDAKQLNRACLGSSILRDAKVRTLLTTPEKGYKQDFTGANLSGAFLKGADLESAIFRDADLSEASLESAVLKDANLTRAQAVGTNFTRASLTGATIESWNIDSTTILKAIDCEFIFLLENMDSSGSRERLPHDSDQFFQPGDFEKFFQEFLDEVKLLIRKGIDPIAFRTAFQKVMEEHSYIDQESIRSLTKKDDDVMLTLQVPVGTDKSEVVRSWEAGYQKGLQDAKNQQIRAVQETTMPFYQPIININVSADAGNSDDEAISD